MTQYNLAGFTHPGGETQTGLPITAVAFEQSVVLVYVQTAGDFWYPLPGFVTASFHYRIYFAPGFTSPDSTLLLINRTEGAGDQEFAALRVLVIPAENVIDGSVTTTDLHAMPYREVAALFGLLD